MKERIKETMKESDRVYRSIQETIKESDSQCWPIVSVPPLSCQPLLVTALIGQLTPETRPKLEAMAQ